ncbi:MAG: hypothetical protein ABWX84_04370 [Nocardioides sp.]
MFRRGPGLAATAAVAVLLLAGCSAASDDAAEHTGHHETTAPSATPNGHGGHGATAEPVAQKPLRAGERFADLRMPEPYTPSAPTGVGTDDYRCFLLDPELTEDAFLTGIDVLPGNPAVVHHVILFQAPPDEVENARITDEVADGEGWTCFGGSGLGGPGESLDSAPWIGAWAPGGGGTVHRKGYGIPLAAGTQVIMQVHYNLLAGAEPDTSAARLRLAPGDAGLKPLETVLLPAPVELPCRPGKTGPLCKRAAAVKDVKARFGEGPGSQGDLLHLLCGAEDAGPVQTCNRPANRSMTIRAAAGHMHLLGRAIKVAVNGRTVLDIPVWDFDDQKSRPVKPVHVKQGDTLTVTCRHDQSLRDKLPAFDGQEERYVVWGEGTTDEMCLGILLVTRP